MGGRLPPSRLAAAVKEMQPELRHLRAFLAVADQGSANRAGAALFRAPSAVSRSVHKLEYELGVELFERTSRGMMPTPAGAALALRLKRALAEIRHAVADVASLRGVTQGTVTVGALPLGRTRLLPESIAGVVAKHPGLRVATMEGSFEALAASLRAGDLDFILGALRPVEYASDLQSEPLADDELGIVCRCGHPWAKRKQIPHRDLARARWVLPRVNTPNRMLFERALTARGLPPPNVVVETSDLAVLRGVLLNSDLLTAISRHQLSYELGARLLTLLPVALHDTRRVIGITQRTDSLASPGAKILMEEIARRCPALLGPIDHKK